MFQFHQERGCRVLGRSQGDGRTREGEMAGEAEEDVHEEVRTEARTCAVYQDTRRGQQRPGQCVGAYTDIDYIYALHFSKQMWFTFIKYNIYIANKFSELR